MINGKKINFKILTVLVLQLLTFVAIAQSPALINYQGMLRDNKGLPVINQSIVLRFEVLQGSDTGPVIYTDDQLSGVSTNSLGLFTTQIGKNTPIGQVNWEQGVSYFLQVSVDPTGGNNLQVLGKAQQLLSVPYALHAQSVPASYTNNVLSIGNKTFNITPTITATPATSITSSGLGTVTSVGTNTFDINIPAPTFSNTGQTIISGTYPNYVVNTPTIPASVVPTIAVTTTAAAASTVLSAGSSFSINVPAPSFSNAGQNIITGTYPNFVVNTPTVPASAVPTIAITNTVAATSTVVSSGNSFSINMPPPTFSNTGQTLITGAYPNFTVNTPTVTAAPTLTATGLATVSAGPNYTVGVPLLTYTPATGALGSGTNVVVVAPTLSLSGNTLSSGPGTNSVLLPTSHTIVGQGIAAVTPSTGSAFTVTVNQPTFAYSNATGSLTSGTSSANITPALTYSNSVITSGPSSNSISLGTGTNAVWGTLGNAGTSTVSNFIGTTDNTELNFRINNTRAGRIENASGSTYFGLGSGPTTNTTTYNSGFGQLTLNSITTGYGNTAMGTIAMPYLMTGIFNTALGGASQLGNISGNSNTSVGYQALRNNVSGNNNVVIGISALGTNTGTTGENTIIGANAFGTNASGNGNTALGNEAGLNTLGSSNVFLGYRAGYNETGSNKLYIANNNTVSPLIYGDFASGYVGINTNTVSEALTVNGNVRFSGALMPNNLPGTAGQFLQSAGPGAPPVWVSSASGWGLTGNAGTSTLTNFIGTTDNVALTFKVFNTKSGMIDQILNNAYYGFQSGFSTSTASLNAGFGQEALKSITTANRNSAFGYQALKNSNGGSNTGIGASALTTNTSGTDNTALGKDAMYLNSTGSFNVGVGSGVMLNHTSGDNNVALGRDVLNGNTSGANNVAVGSLAGYANVSGSGNVFIGYNAGYNETGSNKFILANTSTTTSPLLYGNFATNNLGIGTTSANAPLQFNQTISGRKIVLWEGVNNDHQVYGFGLASNILRYQVDASVASHVFYSGINSSSSLELMRITGIGYVGIGTANPLAMLHVVNTNSVSDGISVDVNNVANGGNAAQIRHFGIGNAGYYEVNNTASNASAMYATSNSGAQYAVRAINTNAALGAYAALIDGGLVTKGKNALNTAYSLRAQNNSSSDLLVVRNDGYVGIGTNAPGTNLHVNSSNNFSQARFTHTASASFGLVLGTDNLSSGLLNYDNTPLYFGTNGANRMSVSNTGNVNIGNFIASQKLNVDGNISLDDAAGSTSPARIIGFPVASTGNHGLLTLQAKSQVFSGTAFSGGNLLLAGGDYNVGSVNTSGSFGGNVTIQAGHNLWPHATGALILFQAGTTSNTERMRIDGATGMVGIGTTAPDQLLTVNGNASKPGGGSWATFSDRRLKKDIHSFNDGLKELLKIEPVWYTYNGEASLPQDTFVGVIAQDLQSIAPYMVKETSRGIVGETNYLSVDNSAMTYMIINAIKEQQKLIEVLTRKIEDQKKEIDTLKKQ